MIRLLLFVVIEVLFGIWGNLKMYIWRLYYVTSFFLKIPRRKEVLEFEELKFLKICRNLKKYLLKHVNLCKIGFSKAGWLY